MPGLTGVWTDFNSLSFRAEENDSQNRSLESRNLLFAGATTNASSEAKIAAIGVHISRSVTSHGFALNVNTDLSYFNLIIPCGITAKPVTSMQQELGKPLDLNAVAESISRNFGTVFSSQMLWVETLDALLGNTVGIPLQRPAEFRQLHKEDDTLPGPSPMRHSRDSIEQLRPGRPSIMAIKKKNSKNGSRRKPSA